jgi:hypothetical protein
MEEVDLRRLGFFEEAATVSWEGLLGLVKRENGFGPFNRRFMCNPSDGPPDVYPLAPRR